MAQVNSEYLLWDTDGSSFLTVADLDPYCDDMHDHAVIVCPTLIDALRRQTEYCWVMKKIGFDKHIRVMLRLADGSYIWVSPNDK